MVYHLVDDLHLFGMVDVALEDGLLDMVYVLHLDLVVFALEGGLLGDADLVDGLQLDVVVYLPEGGHLVVYAQVVFLLLVFLLLVLIHLFDP